MGSPLILYGVNYHRLQSSVADRVAEYAHRDTFVLIGPIVKSNGNK